jgi:hypothetical protein
MSVGIGAMFVSIVTMSVGTEAMPVGIRAIRMDKTLVAAKDRVDSPGFSSGLEHK